MYIHIVLRCVGGLLPAWRYIAQVNDSIPHINRTKPDTPTIVIELTSPVARVLFSKTATPFAKFNRRSWLSPLLSQSLWGKKLDSKVMV